MLSDNLPLTHSRDLGREVEGNLALLEGLLQLGGELFVHRTKDLGKHLDDRHFDTERREEGDELHPDDPTTKDDQTLGQFFQLQSFLSRPEGNITQSIDGWNEGT